MRHILMIALAGLGALAMTGSEAQAQSWGRGISRSYGNVGNFGRGVVRYNYGSYNRGFNNGFNNNFYRGGFRNSFQSIPRPNPYFNGGYGRSNFGGGCRRW